MLYLEALTDRSEVMQACQSKHLRIRADFNRNKLNIATFLIRLAAGKIVIEILILSPGQEAQAIQPGLPS